MTTQQPNQPNQSETLYLQEVIRLAELEIKEQSDTLVATEKKAILLLTLHIAIIGYLLSTSAPGNSLAAMLEMAITFILMASTLIGMVVLYPSDFGVAGINPKYSMDEYFGGNFNRMADRLKDLYEERIVFNYDQLAKKGRLLDWSKTIGLIGSVSAFLWSIFSKYSEVISRLST